MCSNILIFRQWKIVFIFEQYIDTHIKPQIKYGFLMTSSSTHGQDSGEMEPSQPHRGLVSGTLGCLRMAGEPWLFRPTLSVPSCSQPKAQGQPPYLAFSQWLSTSPTVSVRESEVAREGRTQISNCQKIGCYSTKLDSNSVCLDPRLLPNWQRKGRTTASFPASRRHTQTQTLFIWNHTCWIYIFKGPKAVH